MVRFMKNGRPINHPAVNFHRKNSMPRLENGFVYLWALFSVVLAGIVMAGTGQMWQTKSQREKEAELMFIGEEFRKAIMSYYNSGTKQYPDSLEDLLKDDRSPNIKRHLRKIYVDPITNTTEWGIVEEPPPNTTPAAANKGPAQKQGATPNQSSAQNQGSTANTSLTPAANTGSSPSPSPAPDNNSTPASSSGISSGIGKRIIGVYSLSEKKPIKKDQFPEHFAKFSEALTYKDWQFAYKPDSKTPSASGSASAKPNAASTPSASPFASQSPSAPSSKTASPFSSQSSPASGSKSPAAGFPTNE